MTFPNLANLAQQVIVPPYPAKVVVQCCGWMCGQGVPMPWQCPGCLTWHTEHVPVPDEDLP